MAVLTLSLCASAQTRTVKGTVVDAENDEPLIGVSVTAGSQYGVSTDIDGNFTLQVPAVAKQLTVSYVGYKTQHVTISDKPMMIRLVSDSELLDEVIAVAYGTATKASFTGSAAVVDAAVIENATVTDPLNALKGRVAGVQLSNASGAPGSDNPSIKIRGISSINAGTDPLIIVDGTPYSGSMNTINTNDIETMTVLKDAASAALYGARGANGVILITTKRAKAGEARVTVDVKLGQNSRAQQDYDYIKNPAMYYETYYKALNNYAMAQGMGAAQAGAWANQNLTANNVYGLGYNVYTTPNGQPLIGTNGKFNPNATLGNKMTYNGEEYFITPDSWLDAAYKHGLRQEYNLAVAQGGEKTNFYFSANYLDNEGITPQSGYKRLSGRLAADTQAKSWLKISADVTYSHFRQDAYGDNEGEAGSTGNPFTFAANMAPIYPVYVRDGNGQIKVDENGHTVYDYGNNNAGLARPYLGSNSNAIGDGVFNKDYAEGNSVSATAAAEIKLPYGFKFTTNNNVDLLESRATSFSNPWYGQIAVNTDHGGSLAKGHSRTLSYTLQQLLNWSQAYGAHNISVLLGHEYYWRRSYSLSASRQKLFDFSNMELYQPIIPVSSSSYTVDYNNEGWLFRGQYDYDGKYFASGSYRRDASSRFHPKHRWGSFWSFGAAWIINKEDFLTDATWIDMLKLKASYGEQGNDNIPNWLYTNQYTVENSNDQISVQPYYMGNENITWEKNGNFNAGVEFAFFNNRLSGSVEAFYRKTSDMLFSFPLPPSMGWTSYYTNIGDMANTGVEIDLHGTIVNTKDFTLGIDFNLTWYKNEITRLPEERRTMFLEGTPGYSNSNYYYGEGKPLYTFRMQKYAGVDPKTGQSMWYKYKSDVTDKTKVPFSYDVVETTTDFASADYFDCGTALAPVYGGFGLTAEYKWFDLSVNFDYSLGGQCYDTSYASLMSNPTSNGGKGSNIHADILNAWTPSNTNTNIPRYQYGDIYTSSSSDRWLTSASYLSLQNINFGITLPENWTRKLYLQKCRFYASADNVWLWSKRQGLDPRLSLSGGGNSTYYSPIRNISGGVNITF